MAISLSWGTPNTQCWLKMQVLARLTGDIHPENDRSSCCLSQRSLHVQSARNDNPEKKKQVFSRGNLRRLKGVHVQKGIINPALTALKLVFHNRLITHCGFSPLCLFLYEVFSSSHYSSGLPVKLSWQFNINSTKIRQNMYKKTA